MNKITKEFYTCPRHNIKIEYGVECQNCVSELLNLDIQSMSPDDKVEVWKRWFGDDMDVITVSMEYMYGLAKIVIGRPVYTQEFFNKESVFIAEILTNIHPTDDDIIAEFKDMFSNKQIFGYDENGLNEL